MPVMKEIHCSDWRESFNEGTREEALSALESGQIILFPQLPLQTLKLKISVSIQ
jgi:hypothetical protein